MTPADEVGRLEPGSPAYPAALRGLPQPPPLACRGDPGLLQLPLLALFCSADAPLHLAVRTCDLARRLRDRGVPVIGGFQSPIERQAFEFLLRGDQPIVRCPARGVESLHLPAAWKRPLREGRLLLASPFPAALRRPTGAVAEARNRLVAALAERVFIAHARPGGRAHRLAAEALRSGTPVLTYDDPANSDLLLLGALPVAPSDDP